MMRIIARAIECWRDDPAARASDGAAGVVIVLIVAGMLIAGLAV